MATLEQIAAALKRAAAAGDAAAAQKLAAAYKAMQAQQGQQQAPVASPAPPINPDVAALQQAHATMPRPQPPTPQQQMDSAIEAYRMANHPEMTVAQFNDRIKGSGITAPLNFQQLASNDQMFGFGDELAGLASGTAAAMAGKDFGKNYDAGQRLQDARRSLALQNGGPMAGAASLLGNMTSLGAAAPASMASAPATLLGKVGQFAKDTGVGATTGAVLGGVQGFGDANGDLNNRLQGAQQGATTGAIFGAAAPTVVRAVTAPFRKAAQNAIVDAAIKNAPSADDLANASRDLFNSVDKSGVTVDMGKFSQFVQTQVSNAKKMRINPSLDPKATGAYQELIGALSDAQKAGTSLTISDLHTLRQIAQRAAVSTEGRDSMFANRIVDGLDGFISQGGNLKLPANRLGAGSASAGNDMLQAISLWGRAKRVGLVEEAIYKAGNQASGIENGLRAQFRALLQNKKTRALFTPTEIAALSDVANGTGASNLVRLLGKFGFGSGTAGNMLGGTIGFGAGSLFGGPVGGIAAALLGTGARRFSGHLASSAAARAARIVASPGVPNALIPVPRISGTTFPLLQDQLNQPQ